MTDRTALILDVDTGIDDSLALLYAVASADAELIAATCVSGNIDARQVAINTRSILELAGRGDIEVALGREVPLVRALEGRPAEGHDRDLVARRHPLDEPPRRISDARHHIQRGRHVVQDQRDRPPAVVSVRRRDEGERVDRHAVAADPDLEILTPEIRNGRPASVERDGINHKMSRRSFDGNLKARSGGISRHDRCQQDEEGCHETSHQPAYTVIRGTFAETWPPRQAEVMQKWEFPAVEK